MAIKLNGTEITINRLNGTSITEESINGTKVYPTDVYATSWSTLSGTYYDYIASFEQTALFVNPTEIGCGFRTSDLPSASLYLVGDIVRARLNPMDGNPCDTWRYYEAL